ncbi:S-adenosylmethionine:tRNA ribosyltransferase-isomerase, partial [Candidatus Peregrinibacteria bacterium]|nr:S-adenosylmethionine:tRNA ribosyltransferase-isomerase [Candidatus Peregrinibacteria bacterium]
MPPYIKNSHVSPSRYQTVYAKEKGSVAAPTAGLHFTNRLIKELKNMGVQFEEVILHVGRGTFMPVKTEFIDDHKMHCEVYKISKKTAFNLNKAKSENRRIIAIGTTSVRVLETVYSFKDGFSPRVGETNIFIYPGNYKWNIID